MLQTNWPPPRLVPAAAASKCTLWRATETGGAVTDNQQNIQDPPTPASIGFATAKPMLAGVGGVRAPFLVFSQDSTGTSRGGDLENKN